MLIKQIDHTQAEEYFNLFKTIIESDFKEWNGESKKVWLSEQYSLEFWKNLLKTNLPVFVAFDGEKMVGFVAVESLTFGVAYLGWVGVMTEYRKNGLGTELFREIEKWCMEHNIHKIELETQVKKLLPFFKKQGYVLEGIRKNSWQHLDNYLFGKILR